MLGVFIVIFNLVIFIFVAKVITKSIMNINNMSEKFKTMYEKKGKEKLYDYMVENYSNSVRKESNSSFDAEIKNNNNPIKEKRGKRSSI